MSVNTSLLHFRLTSLHSKNPSDIKSITDATLKAFSLYGFGNSDPPVNHPLGHAPLLHVLVKDNGDHITVKAYNSGLLTIDINEYVEAEAEIIFDSDVIKKIEEDLKKDLKALESKSHPPVRRGEGLEVYYPSVDGRLVEYDFVEELRDVRSSFQRVQVLRSESLGNVLVLDGDINLSESDCIYTHTLMRKGTINYKDKSVLILGGGDGGLLYEISLEQPKMIVMVDIDQEVVKAARDLLPGVNKGMLEEMKGHNYEVIIGDALEYMRVCGRDNKTFDYVIYDITAVPVTKQPLSSEWEFLEESMRLSLEVLNPMKHARFLCHSTALLAKESLKLFEGLLKRLNDKLVWQKHPAFVPSFHEVSVFYEIWPKQ